MKRRQLFEVEDQPWCPPSLRDGLTDYLRFLLDLAKPYNSIAPRLASAVRRSGAEGIIDMCSGGGGPWRTLLPALREAGCDVPVRLSDLYPNVAAFEAVGAETAGGIGYVADSLDATSVDAGIAGFRTLFTSFHHFPPETAKRVLQDAVRCGQGIGIFEFTERRMHSVIGSALTGPLMAWLAVPAIRPVRWSRVLWTYPLPVLPLLVGFDGTMSMLRSYTPDELREMVRDLPEFEWEAGLQDVPRMPGGVTYLTGIPR